MLSLEEIIKDKPQNAVYRKTIIQRYPSGDESRWDIFYDEYNNEICNLSTSDILAHPDPNLALSKSGPFRKNTFYIYDGSGRIVKRTFRFMDDTTETRFEYNSNDQISSELQIKNGKSGTSLSYEYDEHNNPLKVHHIVKGKTLYTDEYEYTYDENGRITHKILRSRLFLEMIFHYWFEYDEHGNLSIKKEFREGADVPSYEKYYYDEGNNLIKCESYLGDKLMSQDSFEYEFFANTTASSLSK